MTQVLGRHVLADFYGCPLNVLMQPERVEAALREAARLAGATVIGGHVHHFGEGMGVTGVLLLKESHLSIHTWPEHGYAALDLFMCGQPQLDAALAHLRQVFAPAQVVSKTVARGQISELQTSAG
ncbi:adenosylmethionine decarboxylase [Burkholderiaceae bacterium DAT-1]|nr:adenosylmethionine decarboxylase [Burkholderiaceae bacterium DAT-1]